MHSHERLLVIFIFIRLNGVECVVRMGTSIDGRKPFWLLAWVFCANKLCIAVESPGPTQGSVR